MAKKKKKDPVDEIVNEAVNNLSEETVNKLVEKTIKELESVQPKKNVIQRWRDRRAERKQK